MDKDEYAALRRSIGTQQQVAERLGVHRVTIVGRERGDQRYPIGREAELAIRYLAAADNA
jgi:DNA-binding XRE family transcriptional regulator